MKKFKLTLLFIIITVALHAQTLSGRILDDNGNPIADARMSIETEAIGDSTASDGHYNIDVTGIDKSKTLKVTAEEYEVFKVNIADFLQSQDRTIILKKSAIHLEPVIVNPKKYTLKNYGTSNSKKRYCEYNSNEPNESFREYAIRIENKKKLKIKNININIVDFEFDTTATFIFDIQNAKNGFPDDAQSLVTEPLQLTITENDIKDKKISLNVADKNIWTDKEFFVLVRIAEDFKGRLNIGGNIYAFSKDTYYRNYYGQWKKYAAGEPSINVDVWVEK